VSVTDGNSATVGKIQNGNTTQALLDDLQARGYKLSVNEKGNLCTDPDGPPVTPVIWHALQANYTKLVRLLKPPVTDSNSPSGETIKKDNTDWSRVADLEPARGEERDRALAEYVEAYKAASEVVNSQAPKDFGEGMRIHYREMDKRRSGRDREARRRIKVAKKGAACGKCGRALEDGQRVYSKVRVYAGMAGGLMSRPGPRYDDVSVCGGCAPEWMAKPKAFHEYTIAGETVRIANDRNFVEQLCDTCGRPVIYERTRRHGYYPGKHVFCCYRCQYTYQNRRRSKRRQSLREKVCEVCGKEFTATRSHAKTCSDACKMKAYRNRNKRS
jgi:endogenous inhibitor of DNA gyrase (YacG/DUF329 family)